MQKVASPDLRLWYARKATESGWSRNVLVMQIESGLHEREGRAQNNFPITMPPANSTCTSTQSTTCWDRVKDQAEREWYVRATIEHGWSRAILDYQIDSDLYGRQGKGITNFERTLPATRSDLAQQVLKDPYNFDFLGLGEDAREREVHRGLLQHLREFLVELGAGFAFVGSEDHLEIEGGDYYIDLLFYHLQLRSFVVIELKAIDFKPEYAGKLNFYLAAVDDIIRHADDQPSIGLIICRGKKGLVAEYALRDMGKPIGIAEHRLSHTLPEILEGRWPTVEELEAELGDQERD